MRTIRTSNSFEDELTLDNIQLSITPPTWKDDLQKKAKQYKKLKTSAAFTEWKNSVDNTSVIKTFLDEKIQTASKDKLAWIDRNIAFSKFAHAHLKAIRDKSVPKELKSELNSVVEKDLINKIIAAANNYSKTKSEANLSLWQDLINQLPPIEELILVFSIINNRDQISYLESHIENMEILKQQLVQIEKEENLMKQAELEFKTVKVFFPFNLLNSFCLFNCQARRTKVAKFSETDKCLEITPCSQEMK